MGKQKQKTDRACPVSWRLGGKWGKRVHCANTKGHRGQHRDRDGHTEVNKGEVDNEV